MLNPSTADAENDDPIIMRNRRHAEAIGYGFLIVGTGIWPRYRSPKISERLPAVLTALSPAPPLAA